MRIITSDNRNASGALTPNDANPVAFGLLKEIPDIAALSTEWDLLLEQSPCNRAFSSSTWFLATCDSITGISPRVFTARRGPNLVGILPLVLRAGGQEMGFPHNMSDYQDLIAAPDDPHVLTDLLRHAADSARGNRSLVLTRVRRDSNLARASEGLDGSYGHKLSFDTQHAYIYLPPCYEQYLMTRSQKFRKGIKRAQRLAEALDVSVRELEPDAVPSEHLADLFLALHLSRFGDKSCFQRGPERSFIVAALPKLFKERKVRVFALLERERTIGIDLYAVGANSLCAWNGGFLPEAERWSPGRLFLGAAIRLAYEMRLAEVDLLQASHKWKHQWTNQLRDVVRIEIA